MVLHTEQCVPAIACSKSNPHRKRCSLSKDKRSICYQIFIHEMQEKLRDRRNNEKEEQKKRNKWRRIAEFSTESEVCFVHSLCSQHGFKTNTRCKSDSLLVQKKIDLCFLLSAFEYTVVQLNNLIPMQAHHVNVFFWHLISKAVNILALFSLA